MPSNNYTPAPPHSRVRRRTALAAATTGLALAVTGLTSAHALAGTSSATSSTTDVQSARWAAGYLARQLTPTGYLAPFGTPDIGNTAYAVVALHAAGVGGAAANHAIAFLKTQVATGMTGLDGHDDPARLGYTILAAVSAGQDPRAFGGSASKNNLVARLLATSRTTGPDRGLFGTADPTFDGSFREGVALAALEGAGVAKSRVTANIAWLTAQQCASGFWTSYRSTTSTACPAVNPSTFTGPDTNSTSMAAQGLAAYGSYPRKAMLLKAFHRIQSSDGGFPYLAAAGQSSDPDSTALSIQALLAEGAQPSLPGYRAGGQSPYVTLQGYQLGCSDPAGDRGAFFYPGSRAANITATVQAVPALTHSTFPIATSTTTNAVPTVPCTAGTAATVSAGGLAATPALAGTAGACPGSTGVTVAVDFTAFKGGAVQVRCAPGKPATGVAALQQAGFTPAGTATYGLAFICRINSKPSPAQQPCITTPPTNAYWSYYHAAKGATTWSFSASGASTYKPAQGSIDAWAFGDSAKPSKTPAQVRATKK